MLTIAKAFAQWNDDIKPLVIEQYGEGDSIALSESWNDYTDSLCKDNELTNLQYHYCPSYDDSMPDDDMESEIEWLLEQMGVGFTCGPVMSSRNDGLMSDMPRNFHCKLNRGLIGFSQWYSQGAAHTREPSITDLVSCLIRDLPTSETGKFIESEFSEWCDDFGYDDDSRQAEKIYLACLNSLAFVRNLFTGDELSDLIDLVNEAGL